MKTNFDAWNNRVQIPFTVSRDSVCAGDDGDAPHEKLIEEYPFTDPVVFARAISRGYLASVAGIGHTWTCVLNGVPVAAIAHTGVSPLVQTMLFADTNRVHFVYHSATY